MPTYIIIIITINIPQILRTNRTLKSLSLARNLIKDEGAFALVSVLSKFQLNSDETNWKSMQEQKSNRILEYLVCFNSIYALYCHIFLRTMSITKLIYSYLTNSLINKFYVIDDTFCLSNM